MIAGDAQQHSDSPSCAVSVTAGYGAFALVEGTEGFRLGDDLEPTQVVHIACHCCKTANTLICSKGPDGAWLLRHAPATARTLPAASGRDIEDHANPTLLETGGDLGHGTGGATDGDSWATDPEKKRGQEGSVKVAMHSPSDSSSQQTSGSLGEKEGGDVGAPQERQPGALPREAVQPVAAAAAVVAGTSVLAIAAPEPKRDATKATSRLRLLARNSNSSTCSSWEGDPRAVDEPSSPPLGVPVPIQTTPNNKFTPPATLSREQQKDQQQLYHPGTQKASKAVLPQQHPSAARSCSSSSRKSQQIHEEVIQQGVAGVDEHQHHCSGCRDTRKKAHSDGETSEGSLKLAAIKELQQSPKPKQPPHLEAVPQGAEGEARQCTATGSSCTENGGSSGSNRSHSSKQAQQGSTIAAMAPYMLTRECEGDGNCLYRAFSDQLYGSQEHHLFLRRLAVDVMLRCKDTFEAFVDESEGPFERWLQTKRTYGEWADYREMHALLLLFGTPIFVFDEHLQLLQAFEPDAEKRRPPSQEGEIHTPFRLMWHGKLGHYTSLHYVKEGFPIARGHTIGELEAEGLARLVLSVASGGSSDSSGRDVASKSSTDPAGTPAGLEEEALAECLQVSAQDLAGIAAEQEVILATIKKQRLQQLVPQTTKIVNELWREAKKEQEAWTTRMAKGVRCPPLVPSAMDSSQRHSMVGNFTERRLAPSAVAASAEAADNSTTNVHAYGHSGRGYAGSSGVAGPPIGAPCAGSGGSPGGELQQTGGPPGGLWRENRPGQIVRYDRPQQQMWQEQLRVRQQASVTASPPIACHSQGPPGPVLIASSVGPALVTPTAQGLRVSTTPRSFAYTHHLAPHNEVVEQQLHYVRLPEGRLVLAPSGVLGPARHATLQQQRQSGQQPAQLLPARAAAANGQRQSASSSSNSQKDEVPWFVGWLGNGNKSHGR